MILAADFLVVISILAVWALIYIVKGIANKPDVISWSDVFLLLFSMVATAYILLCTLIYVVEKV